MRRHPIQAVIVVVPVHNEAALLDACLASVRSAVREIRVRCEVRTVLDACTDRSAMIAAQHPFPIVRITANAVGVARARGVESGLAALSHVPPEAVWIAGTDADSTVPAHWLSSQLELARRGADVVLGTVRPDFDDLAPEHRRLWEETHTPGRPNGHTHGANLGVRASTYVAAGGFRALTEHEDVRLVDACRAIEATIIASDDAEVVTSGRFVGRTPGGYAGFLAEQDRMLGLERMMSGRGEAVSSSAAP